MGSPGAVTIHIYKYIHTYLYESGWVIRTEPKVVGEVWGRYTDVVMKI